MTCFDIRGVFYLFIYFHTSGLLVSYILLENWKSANITAFHKKEQKCIPLTTAQLAYCPSNHQQSNGIHHRNSHKIIHFLQQPHLMSSIGIQTWSLYLERAASTLPTMAEALNVRHEMRTVSLDIFLWTYSLASFLALQTVCLCNPRPTPLLDD